MPNTDRALALLTAQLRAYGGSVVTNVVGGHNVRAPSFEEFRVAGSREDGTPARDRLLARIRVMLSRLRNGDDAEPRYDVVFAPGPADGYPVDIPADWVAVIELATGKAVALCHENDMQRVIAGFADWEITKPS